MAKGWRAGWTVSLRALAAAVVLFPVVEAASVAAEETDEARVLMATTTSTANSGLLDVLLPAFESQSGIGVDFVAVGSGAALKLGENGDVDVVLVHAPPAEERFVREGHGLKRVRLMYNDFVLLGPPADPASVSDASGVLDAFRRIAEHAETPFVTRGDHSGTHMREQSIWQAAGLQPEGDWYLDAGQGMAACIGIANEKSAYTLSDRGTFLSMRDRLDIGVLFEADSLLLNPYSIIAVHPKRRPGGNHEGAQKLIAWLTSPEGQETIRAFRVAGEVLFHPDALEDSDPDSHPDTQSNPDPSKAEEP